MDTVVYDRIEDVLGRIESLYGRVEDTYLVAKDILLGTQISDWIADLKASGTASATYSDASRMNVLIANEDAANNSDVAKYLVQWAVANNKYGTYCGAACGAVSGVTWDSLTTPNAVMSNATAFTALCGNSVALNEAMLSDDCKASIWNNALVTENPLRNSSIALNVLNSLSVTDEEKEHMGIRAFLLNFYYKNYYSSNINPVYVTGSYGSGHVTSIAPTFTVNRFVTGWSIVGDGTRYNFTTRYVDFS